MSKQETSTVTTPQTSTTVNVIRTPQSSWIRGVGYHNGILIILTGEEGKGKGRERGRKVTGAMLYSGVPSWIAGLLIAAKAKSKADRTESVGATYSRLVKGKYAEQTVTEKIDELLKLIGA